MGYSVEFGVSVGQWEYAHLTIDGEEFAALFLGKPQPMEVLLGDYHASLRAAILYGRDQAKEMAKDLPSPEELIKSELDAKIIKTVDNELNRELETALLDAAESKSEPVKTIEVGDSVTVAGTTFTKVADKPWERPVKAAASKPWESDAPATQQVAQTGLEDF